jgi:hypothetical protein
LGPIQGLPQDECRRLAPAFVLRCYPAPSESRKSSALCNSGVASTPFGRSSMTNARHRLVGPHALHFKSSARQSLPRDTSGLRTVAHALWPTCREPTPSCRLEGADSLACWPTAPQAHITWRSAREQGKIMQGGYHNENQSCSTRTPEVNTCLNTRTDRRTENYYQGRRPIKQNGPRAPGCTASRESLASRPTLTVRERATALSIIGMC